MNIYLDGPDAVGKTTLCEKIRDEFGYTIKHFTGADPNTFEDYIDHVIMDQNHIYDRFSFGELVYSEIYGRTPRMTKKQVWQIYKQMMKQHDAVIIWTCSDMSILYRRLKARGEESYLKEIDQQVKLFNNIAQWCLSANYDRLIVWDIAYGYEHNEAKLRRWIKHELQQNAANASARV